MRLRQKACFRHSSSSLHIGWNMWLKLQGEVWEEGNLYCVGGKVGENKGNTKQIWHRFVEKAKVHLLELLGFATTSKLVGN